MAVRQHRRPAVLALALTGAEMRRLLIISTLALLLASAGLVAADQSGSVKSDGARQAAIAIRGHVTGLYPGASKWLRLRLHNRSRRDLLVTSVRARVLDPGDDCPARTLQTRPRKLRRLVPGRTSARIRYRVGMIKRAAKSCQGERFPLRYRARVRR
ncbi:MAG TPA: hypothetical protein VFH44_01540 [Solirubrobacterales bacterium]|nr:hypothetical protein [Solirubrobacterales bacterium]